MGHITDKVVKERINKIWKGTILPGDYWSEDYENFNPYDGVLEKEFRMSWELERYINELDRLEEEKEPKKHTVPVFIPKNRR